MRKILFLLTLLVLTTSLAMAQLPEKKTHLFAVKGADSLYLDHYSANVEGLRPCVIYIFGGGFVNGVRYAQWYEPYFEMLIKEGYDVVSIDYRRGLRPMMTQKSELKPSIRDVVTQLHKAINMAVEDLFSATAYIVENAEKMQINPTQIITSGSSAGAITALQAEYAISNQNELTKILPEGFKYAGAMSFAGAIFSVDGKLKWGKQPAPIALFHGNADRQVPYDNETILGIGFYGPKYISKQMSKAKWAHWFYDMEYQGHNIAGQPMFENHNEIKTFIKEYALKRRPLIKHTVVKDGDLKETETKFKLKDYIEANFGK
jgi:predicted esterase